MNFFVGMVIVCLIVVGAVFMYQTYGDSSVAEGASFKRSITLMRAQVGGLDSDLDGVNSSYNALAVQGSENAAPRNTSVVEPGVVEPGMVEPDALSVLVSNWNYSYGQAQLSYIRFNASLVLVQEQADTYFEAQRLQTERYNNPNLKARAEIADAEEQAKYRKWLEEALSVQREIGEAMKDLADVDTSLNKVKLRRDLSAFSADFSEVPYEISDLLTQLDDLSAEAEVIDDGIKLFFEE